MNAKDTCRGAEENHPNRRRSYKNEHLDRQQQEDRQDVGRQLPAGDASGMALSAVPAGAAVTSAKAFSWGNNSYGQLGNGASWSGTDSDVPVVVKNLTGVTNMDGGYEFTVAVTQ